MFQKFMLLQFPNLFPNIMPYNIFKINNVTPQDYKLFFCDANVWIAALKYFGSGPQKNYEAPYVDFFQAIIELNVNIKNEPKLAKKIKNKPKIVLTSVVLSETINAYMRGIAMKAYFNGDTTGYSFKNDYRDNPNSDYKTQFDNLVSDISAFKDYTVLIDDDFSNIKPFELLKNMPSNTDFNDFYYYKLLKDKKIPIITHDTDFLFEDIPIITNNHKLLKKSNKKS